MPITARVVINFHTGAGAVTAVTANNVTSAASGTLVANLVDINNATTGASLTAPAGRTMDTGGRAGTGPTLDQQINAHIAYRDVSGAEVHRYVIQLPAGHGACDVSVYSATSYAGQQALSIDVNSVTVTNHDASNQLGGNASAAPVFFEAISPDGSNQIVITVDNSNQFAAVNGIVLDPVAPPLSGAASGAATAAGNLQVGENLDVDAAAVATASGNLSKSVGLQGAAAGQATASGAFALPFSDDFEAGGGAGSLEGWSIFQPGNGPTPSRIGGRYDSGSIAAVGSTTWFNADRGVAVWKLLEFPGSGQPDKEIIFHNVGVGPTANPTAELTFAGASHYALAGAVIHTESTAAANYEFLVVGHRGSDGQYTLETKTTASGASQVSDVGDNAVGAGITHADLRLTLRNDNTVRWAYRPPGGSSWTPINTTGVSGVAHGGGLTYSSGKAWVGLVSYAFSAVPTAFRGVCDKVELVGEIVATHNLAGAATAQATAAAAMLLALSLQGNAAAVASAAAAMQILKLMAGAAQGQALSAGQLQNIVALATAAGGEASAGAAVSVSILLAGAGSGQVQASGTLSSAGEQLMAGAAAAVATAQGVMQLGVSLAGATLTVASATGVVQIGHPLAAAAVVAATLAGELALSIVLVGDCAALATASGSFDAIATLQGAAAGAAGASGDLAVTLPLQANAQALSTAGGGIVLTIPLDGQASARGQAGGSLLGDASLASEAGAVSTATVTLWLNHLEAGAARTITLPGALTSIALGAEPGAPTYSHQ